MTNIAYSNGFSYERGLPDDRRIKQKNPTDVKSISPLKIEHDFVLKKHWIKSWG